MYARGCAMRLQSRVIPLRRTISSLSVASNGEHHDLDSFEKYTSRTGLSRESTTYVGTRFEYTALRALTRYGLQLERVGGKGDLGIDLLGTWPGLGSIGAPLKTFVQCKVLSKRAGPNLIRELEGAFGGAPASYQSKDVLGCLVTSTMPTINLKDAMQRCRVPIMYASVRRETGTVAAWMWNIAARDAGLHDTAASLRYTGSYEVETNQEIVLTNGRDVVAPID